MPSIEHLNTIKAPASKIYEALVTQQGLGEVWTTDLVVKPEVGVVNEFRFGNETDRMKITRLEPEKRIEWLVMESDPQWIGTVISFDLSENNGVTSVVLKQEGWKEVTDFYRFCNYHWAWFLYSLKTYCEEGNGIPYQRRKF